MEWTGGRKKRKTDRQIENKIVREEGRMCTRQTD